MRCLWLILLSGIPSVWGQSSPVFRVRQAVVHGLEVQIYFDAPQKDGGIGRVEGTLGGADLALTSMRSVATTPLGITVIIDPAIRIPASVFEEIRSGLLNWVGTLPKNHLLRIWVIGDTTTQVWGFSPNRDHLTDRLQAMKPLGIRPNLYQMVEKALAIRQERSTEIPERQVVVLISDGRDASEPEASHESVLRSLAIDPIPIFVVGVSEGPRLGLTRLAEMAKASGGVFFATGPNEVASSMTELHRSLKSGWVGTFLCPDCASHGQVARLSLQQFLDRQIYTDGIDVRLWAAHQSTWPTAMARLFAYLEVFKWWILGLVALFSLILFVFWLRIGKKQGRVREPDTRSPHTLSDQIVDGLPRLPVPTSVVQEMHPIVLTFTVVEGPIPGAAAVLGLDAPRTFGRNAPELPFLGVDKSISAKHFTLSPSPNGGLLISDEGSTNKTFVNGIPIQQTFHLHPDDVVRVGKTAFRIHF